MPSDTPGSPHEVHPKSNLLDKVAEVNQVTQRLRDSAASRADLAQKAQEVVNGKAKVVEEFNQLIREGDANLQHLSTSLDKHATALNGLLATLESQTQQLSAVVK